MAKEPKLKIKQINKQTNISSNFIYNLTTMCLVGRRGGHAFMRFNLKEWHYKVSLRWDSCQKVDHQATSKNFSWFLVLWGYVRTENKRLVFCNHPKQVKINMISTCGLWAISAGVSSWESERCCSLIFLLSQRSLILAFFWVSCKTTEGN